jgi:hypothetical protein
VVVIVVSMGLSNRIIHIAVYRTNAENRKEVIQAMTALPALVDLELSPL